MLTEKLNFFQNYSQPKVNFSLFRVPSWH